MRLILFIGVIGLLFSCTGESETAIGQYTTIEFDEVYDAGTVAKGEIVKARIEIKNTGDYPLVIAGVRAACSCTVSEYEEDPIPPGSSTFIKAEIDTDKTGKGVITKSVTVSANTKPSSNKITIKSKVID